MLPSTNVYSRDLESLLNSLPEITPNETDLIAVAYQRAEGAHSGQKRKSGEPYFTHCVAVASILAEMKMDAETIAAGLLHDVAEDSDISIDDPARRIRQHHRQVGRWRHQTEESSDQECFAGRSIRAVPAPSSAKWSISARSC